MGAKHKHNVGPAPALSYGEMEETERCSYEQATGKTEAPRRALGQKDKLSLDQGAKMNFT